MKTKLFEQLVIKFSIKVTDLIKYLDVSKATIYNYRNLEKFSDIPRDKQLKIFYLFGKESEQDLELVVDEADTEILTGYLNRISGILKESVNDKTAELSSLEELTSKVFELTKENDRLKMIACEMDKFNNIDVLTRAILFEKIANIVSGTTTAGIKEFVDYLDIFEKYSKFQKIDK